MACVALLTSCETSRKSPPGIRADERPNVLIIVTDDQRARGTLRVMPQTRRWFARRGTAFENAYVTTPLCCPSRASVFTGRYAHNHRVLGNRASSRLDQSTTLQHALQEAGYFTAIAGKYLNSWPVEKDPPDFDRWAVFPKGYYDVKVNLDGSVRPLAGYSTDIVKRASVSFLKEAEQQDDRPWYLYVAPTAPHPPFEPAARYRRAPVPPRRLDPAMREEDTTDKPGYLATRKVGKDVPPRLQGPRRIEAKAATIRRLQLRTLLSVDDLVQRLMRKLGKLRERRDTLAFFLSDNGYLWGEHRAISKNLPYIPSIEIPFLARLPGDLESGVVSDRPTLNVDVAPTVAEVTGLSDGFKGGMDGVSILHEARRPRLFFEHWGSYARGYVPPWFSIRTARYHFIVYPPRRKGPPILEYYDLTNDPWELTNVFGDDRRSNDPPRARIERLVELVKRYRKCSGASCP